MVVTIFLPQFENENKKCFCINQNVMQLLRQDGEEEIILYFSKSFWDRYPKPFGIERMREIIRSFITPIPYIAVIAEWKYLDKYARTCGMDVSIPSSFEEYLNEHRCISVPIVDGVDKQVDKSEGWGILTCPGIYNSKSKSETEKFYLDPSLEEKIISLEMMNANEKLVQFYDHNLGQINISIN